MRFPRASGILLHPTSLPGPGGIGDLGEEACRFADFLAGTGQGLWQMLPLGPANQGNPYMSLSVSAGNPLLISLQTLAGEGFLEPADLDGLRALPSDGVDFNRVAGFKAPLFRKSLDIFRDTATPPQRQEFEDFCAANRRWLDDYALFMALREAHGLASWNTWEAGIRGRAPEAVRLWTAELAREMDCHRYQQFRFFQQWRRLKAYCNDRGIRLIGDIPVFVAYDSVEVWSQPGMFYLDPEGNPTVVAGVPPDYFSETGQRWGNPLYRWDVMAQDGYRWWIDRFRRTLSLVDIVRLDHFRGFESYWEIPADESEAVKGRWVPGPGARFFEALEETLGSLPIIAEDLGVITPEVIALRDRFDFPGMKVLQFAFGGGADNPYLPHNYPGNCVAYTGTHDNNTIAGWFFDPAGDTTQSTEEKEKERQSALKYLGCRTSELNWDFIRLAMASVADTAIVPLQDIMGLGSGARMNRPGTTTGNWRWRFTSDMLTAEMKSRLSEMTEVYGRATPHIRNPKS